MTDLQVGEPTLDCVGINRYRVRLPAPLVAMPSAEGAPRPRTHDGAVALPHRGMHDSTRAAQAARLVRLKPPERAWLACSQGWKEADVVGSKGDAA